MQVLGSLDSCLHRRFGLNQPLFVEDIGPVIQVESSRVLIGVVLGSVVFGAIVAGLSRAAASWVQPGDAALKFQVVDRLDRGRAWVLS